MWFAFGSTDFIKFSPVFGLFYYYYFKIRMTFSIDICFLKLLQLVSGHLYCWGTIFLEQGSKEYQEKVVLNFQKAIQLPPPYQWQIIAHLSCSGVISLRHTLKYVCQDSKSHLASGFNKFFYQPDKGILKKEKQCCHICHRQIETLVFIYSYMTSPRASS